MGALKYETISFNSNMQETILDLIAEGDSAYAITKKLNLYKNAIYDYAAKDPVFSKRLQEIRAGKMHEYVDQLLNITDGCVTNEDVNAARLKSDNIKWTAAKIVPQVYGDRLDLNVNHSLDLSSVLLAAENRIIPVLQAKQNVLNSETIVDAEVIDSPIDDIPDELRELI